jgi:MoxR-like ATPase
VQIEAAARNVRRALDQAARGLVEREVLVDLIALAAVAGEHLLVIGPPGTAKSEAARRAARAFAASYFEYLLGRFTEPNEIFGPIDLRKLREGVVETETSGMLPEAEVAFLDEIFFGSTAILNTLLALLNERTFRRGRTAVRAPLRICIGASNALPEDESLAAFADRFLVRVFVEPIADPRLEELLASGDALARSAAIEPASLEDLDTLSGAARECDLAPVRSELAHAVRILRKQGIALSDRRIVKTQRLIAAAAALDGRAAAQSCDLWPVLHALPTQEQQAIGRGALRELLSTSKNETLAAAAEEASASPASRALRLLAATRALLAEPAGESKKLRVEGLLREIDASLSAQARGAELTAAREQLIESLR